MPDSRVSGLPNASPLTGVELFYADDTTKDVNVTAVQIKMFSVGAGSVSVASNKTLTVSNTLTLAGTDGKTVTLSNSLTLSGTDGSTLNVGSGGTLGTAAFKNTGTSGSNVPVLNGANIWSGAQSITDTTASTSSSTGCLVLSGGLGVAGAMNINQGVAVGGTLTAQANVVISAASSYSSLSNGQGLFHTNSVNGLIIQGQGSTYDLKISSGNNAFDVFAVPTGTGNLLMFGKFITAPSASGSAGLNVPSGTAPSLPSDGDMWYDGTNVKFRVGGTTKTFSLT